MGRNIGHGEEEVTWGLKEQDSGMIHNLHCSPDVTCISVCRAHARDLNSSK